MDDVAISIIIPVLNQVERLEVCLEELRHQIGESTSFEVLVVDNGSSDGSDLLADRYQFTPLPLAEKANPYIARNHGATIAKGEILVFLDAKCTPRAGYVNQIQKWGQKQDWDVVSGDFKFVNLTRKSSLSELAYAVMHLRTNPKYNGGEIATLTGNMMVRKAVFWELSGFDTQRSGGDIRFSQKVKTFGKRIFFDPALVVAYEAKQQKDLIQSLKRDGRDAPYRLPWYSVRPAGMNYIRQRLTDLGITVDPLKLIRLSLYIMYLRFIKYSQQR